jgi:hypothetical protein
MKPFKYISALVFAAIISMLSTSEVKAFLNLEVIIEDNSNIVTMKMVTPGFDAIDFTLLNERNRLIRQERAVSPSSLEHSFDFGNLKDGRYTVISEINHLRYNKIFEVRGSQVEMIESFSTFAPVFKMEDEKIFVHYPLNGQEDIGISIESEKAVYFDSYFNDVEQVFSQAFDIDLLSRGSYTLTVATQGQFYDFDFEVTE